MRSTISAALLAALACACASTYDSSSTASAKQTGTDWQMNASIIEACSCPMFCQCYFNTQPASHPGCCPPGTDPKDAPRYCRFNNAYRVNHGSFGSVKLDGAKFWAAGDLGGDFSKNEFGYVVVHFDPSVTPEQREGIKTAMGALYPVKWGSFTVGADYPIEWTASRDHASAKLDGGKVAEVALKKNQGMSDAPIVIQNLKYWGAPRNDGFVLMANEVEAYRTGDKPYEYKGTNGFMITFDIGSKDAQPKKAY